MKSIENIVPLRAKPKPRSGQRRPRLPPRRARNRRDAAFAARPRHRLYAYGAVLPGAAWACFGKVDIVAVGQRQDHPERPHQG